MKRMAGVAAVAVCLVAGCSGGAAEHPIETVVSSPASEPLAPSSTPSSGSSDTADSALPSRAEMEDWERAIAVGTFISTVRADGGFDAYADDALTDAGDAACDTMDRGDSLQSVLITVAGLLPSAESTDAVAGLAGVAAGSLCPEHAGYSG